VEIPGRAAIDIYPENNYDVHVGLRQTIYDFGRTDASVNLARSGRDVAEGNLEQVKRDLAYRTMSAFNAILILRSNLAVLDEQIQALIRHLDVTRKRVQAGTSTDFDALTTEVRIAAARSERIDAANVLEGQEIQFRELTGLGSQKPVVLKGEFISAALRLDPDSLLKEASRQRPELLAARATENSAGLQSHLYSLGMRPSLTANLTSGFKNGYSPDLNELKANFFAGLQANVPLFDGHRTRSQTREAEAALLAAKARTQDLERQIAAEVEQAVAGAGASQQKIQNAELQVTQAERAVSMAQTRYQAGVATNLDVLDAQTALTQARLSRLRALYNYTASLTAVDRASGRRLW
jgi:outer membrane protein TolC